jgi:23S rRNA (guanosine2251-2'-O)-methyltransferase
MPATYFEIRVCTSCGLRYPISEGNSFGDRCPVCLGQTEGILKKHFNNKTRSDGVDKKNRGGTLAVLADNIRSAWNVGSILRSADGFGFLHAYLCGFTPTPEHEAVRKTSLGAEEFVTWSYHKDALRLARGLKNEGWKVIALEEHERATKLSQLSNTAQDHNTVLVLGSEVSGVDPQLLDLADDIFYIPMHGEKRSFNVANAFSIAAYALVEQRG